MKRLFAVLSGTMLLALGAAAQTPAQKYIDAQISKEPLSGAVWGILARRADGTVLAEYNAHTRMVPASNLKKAIAHLRKNSGNNNTTHN